MWCLKPMIKRKRIYYVPGLISLVAFPIIIFYYAHSFKQQVVLKFYLASDNTDRNNPVFAFSKWRILGVMKKKKIVPVYLDGDHKMNFSKLRFIQLEAQRLKFTCDTTQVLRVRLSYETNFEEFVSLLNIMYMNQQKRYCLIDNDFYIFGENRPVENKKTIEPFDL